jgi:hypothetical protein
MPADWPADWLSVLCALCVSFTPPHIPQDTLCVPEARTARVRPRRIDAATTSTNHEGKTQRGILSFPLHSPAICDIISAIKGKKFDFFPFLTEIF